ncbi:hypothetical protein [Clostridium thailandense]|uniref:hypothetical protein n=1 Tax=Clostridium thailandense TaxID=2794346 RepID=UPI003989E27B
MQLINVVNKECQVYFIDSQIGKVVEFNIEIREKMIMSEYIPEHMSLKDGFS